MCSKYSLLSLGVRIQRHKVLKETHGLYSVFLLHWVYLSGISRLMDLPLSFFVCVCVDDWAEEKQAEDGFPGSNTSQPSHPSCTLKTGLTRHMTLIQSSQTGILFSDLELLEKYLGTVSLKLLTRQTGDVSRVSCLRQIPNGNAACGLLTIKYYLCFKCHCILLVLCLAVTGEQSKSRWTSGCTSLTGVTAALEVP